MAGRRFLLAWALSLIFLLAACAPPAADIPEPLAPTATPAAGQPDPAAAPTSAVLIPLAPADGAEPAAAPTSAVLIPLAPADQAPAAAPPAAGSLPSVTRLPDPAAYEWVLQASGLSYPLGITHAGDGSGRVFIFSQTGLVYILQDRQVLETPFLDLSSVVSGPAPGTYSERGLLGLAFHPRYAENGYFYVNYTAGRESFISRFQVSADPNRADAASETVLLKVAQPYPNHNGGALAFGPEGYLYIGLGDGGAAGDPEGRGQSLDTHLGKILRISVDAGEPYTIPADNPFANGGGLPEIWAYGLRNPWRFAFDTLTGDFYIGDVGQNQWEEINYLPAGSPGGENFGWDYREGLHEYEGSPPAGAALVDPVAEYSHENGCSVTGGVVVRDPLLPELQGVYLYGDYCSGKVWGLWRDAAGAWQSELMFETDANITAFGVAEDGRVFLADLQGASVYTLQKK